MRREQTDHKYIVVEGPIGVGKTSFSTSAKSEEFKDPMVAGAETDVDGFYTIAIPAGSYFIKTFLPPERGFISSEEKSITIADGETLTVNLQLKKAERKITGTVFKGTTPVSEAFVSGWSQKGGYQE